MKKNTKLLLLSCLSSSEAPQEERLRSYEFFYDLFSDMSEGGIRSIVFDLVKKGFLKRFYLNSTSFFEITSAGISKLTLLYPGLKPANRRKGDGEGHLVLFVSAPEHDPHFQMLRKKLKQHFFVQLSKGAYYFSFSNLPNEIFELLLNKYSASVSLIVVKSFSLAFPDQKKLSIISKNLLKNSLSEVSRKSLEVIDSLDKSKKTFYQLKNNIFSSFKILSLLLEEQRTQLVEDKTAQESYFQAFYEWSSACSLFYFSQKMVRPK